MLVLVPCVVIQAAVGPHCRAASYEPACSRSCCADGEYDQKPERETEGDEEVPKVIIRSGKGVYKWEGNEYEGDWKDDKMHGAGNFKFMGGCVYNVSDSLKSPTTQSSCNTRLSRSATSLRLLCSCIECRATLKKTSFTDRGSTFGSTAHTTLVHGEQPLVSL